MPISLGFWEWGCPKRGGAHITVTPGSKLIPRAFAVEIKANEVGCPKKQKKKTTTTF